MNKPIPPPTTEPRSQTSTVVIAVMLVCGLMCCLFLVGLLGLGLVYTTLRVAQPIDVQAIEEVEMIEEVELEANEPTPSAPAAEQPSPRSVLPIQATGELDADVQERVKKAIEEMLKAGDKDIINDLADAAWSDLEISESPKGRVVRGTLTAGGQSYEYECNVRRVGDRTKVEAVSLK